MPTKNPTLSAITKSQVSYRATELIEDRSFREGILLESRLSAEAVALAVTEELSEAENRVTARQQIVDNLRNLNNRLEREAGDTEEEIAALLDELKKALKSAKKWKRRAKKASA